MKNIHLKIKSVSKKYSIKIGHNIISRLSEELKKNEIKSKKYLLVIDKNVPKNMISKITKSINKKKFFYYFNANE